MKHEAIVANHLEEIRKNIGLTLIQVPNQSLVKSSDDYLGAMIKGGKHQVGLTKSGKPVYENTIHNYRPGDIDFNIGVNDLNKIVKSNNNDLNEILNDIKINGTLEKAEAGGKPKYSKKALMDAEKKHMTAKQHLEKELAECEDDDMEKSLKPIGKTHSGKNIYKSVKHSSYSNFTIQDHKDASRLNFELASHPKVKSEDKAYHVELAKGHIKEAKNIDLSDKITLLKANNSDIFKSNDQVFFEESVLEFATDLQKAFDSGDIDKEAFEKGIKDITKLQKKIITNKDGFQQTVYVRQHEDGTEHHFKTGDKVKFEHEGKQREGMIMKLKHHEKFDKFGTAEIHDHNDLDKDGKPKVYSRSLRAIEHHAAAENSGDFTPEEKETHQKVKDTFAGKNEPKSEETHPVLEQAKQRLKDKNIPYIEPGARTAKEQGIPYGAGSEVSFKGHHSETKNGKIVSVYRDGVGNLSYSIKGKDGIEYNMDAKDFKVIKHSDKAYKFSDEEQIKKYSVDYLKHELKEYNLVNDEKEADNLLKTKKETLQKLPLQKLLATLYSNYAGGGRYLTSYNKNLPTEKAEKLTRHLKIAINSYPGTDKSIKNKTDVFGISGEKLLKNVKEVEEIKKSIYQITEQQLIDKANNLQKALDNEEISFDYFEKAIKDITQLQKKQIINKDGHKQTVYVRVHDDKTEHHFTHGDSVKFEHHGKTLTGTIKGLLSNEKTDKFGTAVIYDDKGNKYNKSLRQIEHHVTPAVFDHTEGGETGNLKDVKDTGKSIGGTESEKEDKYIKTLKEPNGDFKDYSNLPENFQNLILHYGYRGNIEDTMDVFDGKDDEIKEAEKALKEYAKQFDIQSSGTDWKDYDEQDEIGKYFKRLEKKGYIVMSGEPGKYSEDYGFETLPFNTGDDNMWFLAIKPKAKKEIPKKETSNKEETKDKPKLEGVEAINLKQKQLKEVEAKIKNHKTGAKSMSDEDLTNAENKAKLLKIIIKRLADKSGIDLRKSNK